MNNSYEILKSDFKNIGICQGDVLVVHSSLKSMGYVDGGALYQRYDRTLSVLDDNIAKIHGAESVLIDSVALKEKAVKKFKECPLYFVDDPNGYYSGGCGSHGLDMEEDLNIVHLYKITKAEK